MTTRVVNLRKEPYDVYIGRKGRGMDGTYGNPYQITVDCDRDAAIERYRIYFLRRIKEDPDFRAAVLSLKDRTLGCFCYPLPCHGEVIAKWLDSQ